jgi:hypothetical protein
MTYTNLEAGIEAIVTEGNEKYPFRAILRDTDADATVSVIFGSLEVCTAKAKAFTNV